MVVNTKREKREIETKTNEVIEIKKEVLEKITKNNTVKEVLE